MGNHFVKVIKPVMGVALAGVLLIQPLGFSGNHSEAQAKDHISGVVTSNLDIVNKSKDLEWNKVQYEQLLLNFEDKDISTSFTKSGVRVSNTTVNVKKGLMYKGGKLANMTIEYGNSKAKLKKGKLQVKGKNFSGYVVFSYLGSRKAASLMFKDGKVVAYSLDKWS